MKKFKNHQRPRRKYRFDIVGHKKALKIWWDSPFKLHILSKENDKFISNKYIFHLFLSLKRGGRGRMPPEATVITYI
jgi:hypothetical protein